MEAALDNHLYLNSAAPGMNQASRLPLHTQVSTWISDSICSSHQFVQSTGQFRQGNGRFGRFMCEQFCSRSLHVCIGGEPQGKSLVMLLASAAANVDTVSTQPNVISPTINHGQCGRVKLTAPPTSGTRTPKQVQVQLFVCRGCNNNRFVRFCFAPLRVFTLARRASKN